MIRTFMAALLVSTSVFAEEDDCTLSADAVAPQLDTKKLPKGAKVVLSEKKERVHREVLRFGDELEATVQVGGCAHLGISLEVRSKTSVSKKLTPAQGIALIKQVFARLPLKPQPVMQPKLFLDALAALKTTPPTFPVELSCGEFTTCELNLDTTGKEPALIIWYSFAL